LGRIFHDMNEQILNAGSDFSSHMLLFNQKLMYKAGFFFENRNRAFSARNLGYKIAKTSLFDWDLPYETVENVFCNDNINATDGIMLDEQTSPSDSYTSQSAQLAGYFTVTVPIGSRVKIHTGIRAERSLVSLDSYKADATNPPSVEDEIHYLSDTVLFLPAVNISFSLTEKSLMRLAYGQTVNRPEYREIAPMSFYDYEMKAVITGNDSLTFATIHNFDLRYEFYPDAFSMFSLGAFHKQFINAIEYQIIPTGSGLQYSFQNTPEASVSGLEAEMRLTAASLKGFDFLRNFTVIFNAAVIKSRICFNENSLEKDRALQGQSPFILNASLFYQNDSLGLNAGLMYNVVGKRISFVGDPFTGNPHIYEMPANQLDLSLSKKVGNRIELKAQVRNLLNNNTEYRQTIETENGTVSQTTMQYKPGRYYLLGLAWKI
ncbi:MAG TPA: TonB-dependent receptor, partial [Bacteroidales bacterium]|nr:TonB-dependent receptor [Bacteroidales bacterium]